MLFTPKYSRAQSQTQIIPWVGCGAGRDLFLIPGRYLCAHKGLKRQADLGSFVDWDAETTIRRSGVISSGSLENRKVQRRNSILTLAEFHSDSVRILSRRLHMSRFPTPTLTSADRKRKEDHTESSVPPFEARKFATDGVKMAIYVTHVRDPLHKNDAEFARVIPQRIVEPQVLYRFMTQRGAFSPGEVEVAMERLKEALIHFLAEGRPVRTSLGVFTVGVHAKAALQSRRRVPPESVVVHLRVDKMLYHELRSAVEIVVQEDRPRPAPQINSVLNADDRRPNNSALPADVLVLCGHLLSFQKNDPNAGIFFVALDGTATRAEVYPRTGIRRVSCKVPDLSPGNYRVEARVCRRGGAMSPARWAGTLTVDAGGGS